MRKFCQVIMVPRSLCIKLNAIFAIVLLRFEYVFGTCLERDEQIQKYLTSSKSHFDNYFNISKAVYPSVDLPSLLIDITVKFLKTADEKSNGSNSSSTLEQNVSRSTTFEIRKFKWSMSCLYVSGGISLSSMNWFSLGAIYPNRRGSKLHITLPQFCNGFTVDRQDTMIYFLSTLQDIAVLPLLSDPRLNTAECVIPEHGKAPQFFGAKQLLHGVSWSLLIVSLTMSTFSSQLLTLKLRSWNGKECYRSKIAATMLLSTFLFLGGFSYNLYICISATKVRNKQEMSYVWVFFGSILLVCFRRMCWCMYFQGVKGFCTLTLTEGHGEKTSKNIFSGVALYPAVFIACHHLLWILLGVITEPLWGVTVLIAVITTCAMFFFSLSELYHIFSKNCSSDICCGKKKEERNQFCMSVFMILTILFAFVLFVVVLIVVTQVFQSESLILTLIQNIMTGVVTVWFGYVNIFKESNQGDEGEGGDKCNGNGAEGRGCKGKRKRKRSAIQETKISQSREENV